ncbi:TPA: ribosome silencing factor [Legionella feeleii]|uniref:Ribosomal silencing factor RsfS n=1 Tax=Legionella feeleii TaxID=453 RepID=A0A0W0U509_9GAMM|nr:ribosome silencing factor [Legionella feeleii]KTD03166.1 Ribosomal silencing factor RsfS [Legionella feeleii]SPX59778.1 putative Iojap-related protein [Legionella feeleii]STX38391.1 putative Iojap-related protein [Legionella feeleii]
MSEQQLFLKQLLKSLDDIQAIDVVVIDVKNQTSVTDYMIICSGRSSRHVKAIAELVIEQMKAAGLPSLSQNGLESGEWALIDFGDFVLHVMQPDSRAFYNLEGLWQTTPPSK